MPQSPIELVIFDCDGVLVDSEPISLAVLVEALERSGLKIDEQEASDRFLGRSLKSMSDILHDEYGLAIDDHFLENMRHSLYARFRADLRPIESVRATVDALTVPCCVASSSQPERIRLSLSVTGLLDRFEPNIFSATMVPHGKPAPDLFLYASAAMDAPPSACVVIEDSPAGIMAAQAAGMRVFAFTGGSHARNAHHRDTLARLKPDLLFDEMPDLLQFVQKVQPTGT